MRNEVESLDTNWYLELRESSLKIYLSREEPNHLNTPPGISYYIWDLRADIQAAALFDALLVLSG
jgi:hypothetical protein